MALRWFVGLNLDQEPWEASTFRESLNKSSAFAPAVL
jgi:hypothetical protein